MPAIRVTDLVRLPGTPESYGYVGQVVSIHRDSVDGPVFVVELFDSGKIKGFREDSLISESQDKAKYRA